MPKCLASRTSTADVPVEQEEEEEEVG